ncbi:hypothetical protein ACIQU6_35035 [Streptomyces sp. NPDC090442]|uniref:hypothetical protein n=1 Tax=Streptomyces sp. NPDC090442 TaxID=3365962 RepID=UPI0037F6AF9E
MRLVPRLTAALSGLVLALGGVVALAPAAHASPQACYYAVLEQHPDADREVAERACLMVEEGAPESLHACYFELREGSVPAQIAYAACRRAAEE